MPTRFTFIFLFISCLYNLTAFAQVAGRGNTKFLSLSAYTSYKQEDFRWSIAGTPQGSNPNIYSELIWNDLKAAAAGVSARVNPWKQLIFKAAYEHASVYSGTVSDTDYQQDNRQAPSYQETFKSSRGNAAFLEAGLGYQLFRNKKVQLTPLIGFVHDKQLLVILNNEGSDSGLNSTYRTAWSGPYIAAGLETGLVNDVRIILNLHYSQVNYSAKANWNLIDEFAHPVSFIHKAGGYMMQAQSSVNKPVSKTLSVCIRGALRYSVTGAGTDRLFFADGRTSVTRFNEAVRKGSEIGLGLILDL